MLPKYNGVASIGETFLFQKGETGKKKEIIYFVNQTLWEEMSI